MKQPWREPTLYDLLSDPTLEPLLARDGITKDELQRIIEKCTLNAGACAQIMAGGAGGFRVRIDLGARLTPISAGR